MMWDCRLMWDCLPLTCGLDAALPTLPSIFHTLRRNTAALQLCSCIRLDKEEDIARRQLGQGAPS